MMAGMAYEIGAQWRRDDDVATARDSMHYRAAMASRQAHPAGAKRTSHPGLLDRLITTFGATKSVRPAAR